MTVKRHRTSLIIALLTLSVFLLGLYSSGYATFILAMTTVTVVVCVGLNILVGLSGQMSFGHVGFFAIGAYTAGILMLTLARKGDGQYFAVSTWLHQPNGRIFHG